MTSFKDALAAIDAVMVPEDLSDPKVRTRARILRTATELFQAQGYRRVSVDEVAQKAGVAKGTVYLHFKNKADLLFHAITEEKKKWVPMFRPLLAEDLDPKERLRRYIEQSLILITEIPLTRKLLSGEHEMLLFLEDMEPELRAYVLGGQHLFAQLMLSPLPGFAQLEEAERDRRAKALIGLLMSSGELMDARVRSGVPVKDYARTLAKAFVDGIGAP